MDLIDVRILTSKEIEWINAYHEKVYQKLVSIIYEVKPSSNRYIPAAVKRAVLIRDNNSCVKCGATENLHIDHEIALSRGGSNDVDNLQVLCRDCNLRKGVS